MIDFIVLFFLVLSLEILRVIESFCCDLLAMPADWGSLMFNLSKGSSDVALQPVATFSGLMRNP